MPRIPSFRADRRLHPRGTNNVIKLLFGTSLYDLKQPEMPSAEDVAVRNALRFFSPAAALVKVPEAFFTRYPIEAQVALASLADASEVLRRLLDGGHSVVAGRLAGAFRRIGRADIAEEITSAMKSAGYNIRETDPLRTTDFRIVRPTHSANRRPHSGDVADDASRVIDTFPEAPGLPSKPGYLKFVDEIYKSDAYHSLSIEGYSVTPELIERVRAGTGTPTIIMMTAESRRLGGAGLLAGFSGC